MRDLSLLSMEKQFEYQQISNSFNKMTEEQKKEFMQELLVNYFYQENMVKELLKEKIRI